jgi:HAE1 family hydrophobic/amphiphilic exporter-1
MTETFTTLAFALLIALVLVFAVMASLMKICSFPINCSPSLGFIGVVILLSSLEQRSIWRHHRLHHPHRLAVNSIVMVDYINQLIGEDGQAGGRGQGGDRLRPVLITSITTIVGMIPMAMTTKQGGEMSAPMAVAVIGGLTATTFLTLFFIPVLYTYFAKIKVK